MVPRSTLGSSPVRRSSLLLAAGLAAAPLAAQSTAPWRASYYPYLLGNPSTGLELVAHYQFGRQADYEARVPFDGVFTAEAGASLHGSWFVTTKFRAPLLVKGWRVAADLGAVREDRFGYYGRGPDGSNENFTPRSAYPDDFYQVRRTRYFARGEATRRIAGPLMGAVGAGVEHSRLSSVADGTLFASDYFGDPLNSTDVTGRVSLVLDTRDNEYLPSKGLLFEAGLSGGTGRFEERFIPPFAAAAAVPYVAALTDPGYLGGYAHLRGYVSPRDGTVIAGRVAFRGVGRNAPLDARYQFPEWEREVPVYGGAESQRSFVPGRFAGRGLFFAGLEVRHNLLDLGDYGAITLIAFTDAGRAYAEGGRIAFGGWNLGGGGGLAIRILRSAPLVLNFAGGPDGFRFTMSNGWSF